MQTECDFWLYQVLLKIADIVIPLNDISNTVLDLEKLANFFKFQSISILTIHSDRRPLR